MASWPLIEKPRWKGLDVRQAELARFTRAKRPCHPADTDLHNAFFGNGGEYGRLFPTRAEREAFGKTPEYQEIVEIRAALSETPKRAVVRR